MNYTITKDWRDILSLSDEHVRIDNNPRNSSLRIAHTAFTRTVRMTHSFCFTRFRFDVSLVVSTKRSLPSLATRRSFLFHITRVRNRFTRFRFNFSIVRPFFLCFRFESMLTHVPAAPVVLRGIRNFLNLNIYIIREITDVQYSIGRRGECRYAVIDRAAKYRAWCIFTFLVMHFRPLCAVSLWRSVSRENARAKHYRDNYYIGDE